MPYIKEEIKITGILKRPGTDWIEKAEEHEEECKTFIYENITIFINESNDVDQLLHRLARINPTLSFEWIQKFIDNLPKFKQEWRSMYSEKKHYNEETQKRNMDGNTQRQRWHSISNPYWNRRYDLFQKYGQENTYDILFDERMRIKLKGFNDLHDIHYTKEQWIERCDNKKPTIDYNTGKIIMVKVNDKQ